MSDDLIFPKPEPKKFVTRLLELGIEFETDEHISWRVEKEHYDNFNSVPKEKRQQILEEFKKGGITVGEVAEKFGTDFKVVFDIIYLNIQQMSVLRGESL